MDFLLFTALQSRTTIKVYEIAFALRLNREPDVSTSRCSALLCVAAVAELQHIVQNYYTLNALEVLHSILTET